MWGLMARAGIFFLLVLGWSFPAYLDKKIGLSGGGQRVSAHQLVQSHRDGI